MQTNTETNGNKQKKTKIHLKIECECNRDGTINYCMTDRACESDEFEDGFCSKCAYNMEFTSEEGVGCLLTCENYQYVRCASTSEPVTFCLFCLLCLFVFCFFCF